VDDKQIKIAYNIAKSCHSDQMYGDEPYMFHIDGVVENMIKGIEKFYLRHDIKLCPELKTTLICLAYVHDVIEDCPDFNHGIIKNLFGQDFYNMLILLSHLDGSYAEYIEKLSQSPECCLVKAADLMFNIEKSKMDNSKRAKCRLEKYKLALLYLQQKEICVWRMVKN
jgi:(p)ppGpp synthase/HD superfamily hydrolase